MPYRHVFHDNCIVLVGGLYLTLGSICNSVVYFMINCIFLNGDLYLTLGSICDNVVYFMILGSHI